VNYHTLKFKFRYSTSLHVRYHSKFHARSTATAIFEETARTYSRTYYMEMKFARHSNVILQSEGSWQGMLFL